MFCEKCGRKNDDHANHCEGCGAALQGPVAPGAGAGGGGPSGGGQAQTARGAAVQGAQGASGLGHLVPLVAVALVMFLPRTLFGLVIQGGRVFEVKAIDKFVDAHIKGINQTFLFLNVLELVSFILIFAVLFSIVSNKRR